MADKIVLVDTSILIDLFRKIAATAIVNNMPFATLNNKHFDRIYGLDIIE